MIEKKPDGKERLMKKVYWLEFGRMFERWSLESVAEFMNLEKYEAPWNVYHRVGVLTTRLHDEIKRDVFFGEKNVST